MLQMSENRINLLKLLLKQRNQLNFLFIINCRLFKTFLISNFRETYSCLKRLRFLTIFLSRWTNERKFDENWLKVVNKILKKRKNLSQWRKITNENKRRITDIHFIKIDIRVLKNRVIVIVKQWISTFYNLV